MYDFWKFHMYDTISIDYKYSEIVGCCLYKPEW